jgi:hypothetical protein
MGLAAHGDFKLTWTPDAQDSTTDSPGPTIFTAIQNSSG